MTNNKNVEVKRGEIWMADLPIINNSNIQSGKRPVIIVDNDQAARVSPTLKYVPLTTKIKKENFPFHILIEADCLKRQSMALIEAEDLLDRSTLMFKIGELSEDEMNNVDIARLYQSGINLSLVMKIQHKRCAAK